MKTSFASHASKSKMPAHFQVTFFAVMLLLTSTGLASAQEKSPTPPPLFDLSWKTLQDQNRLAGVELVIVAEDGAHKNVLRVVSPAKNVSIQTPSVVRLCEIEAPRIAKPVYMLSGWVRHENVEATAFLEMWSVFPDGSHYFTRTLGTFGPTQSLQGTAGWRQIQLPFQMQDSPNAARPETIILNAVFQGPGTVWLSDMKVTEHESLDAAMKSTGWWSGRAAGLIGGIGGSFIGLFGALVGVLAGRGLARRFVIASLAAGAAFGVALLIGGIVAVALRQPYAVYYPLLLLGSILFPLCISAFFRCRNQYAGLELRRMQSLDAGVAVPSH